MQVKLKDEVWKMRGEDKNRWLNGFLTVLMISAILNVVMFGAMILMPNGALMFIIVGLTVNFVYAIGFFIMGESYGTYKEERDKRAKAD